MTAHDLPVARAVELLDRRELSAQALVRDCLARIDEREPQVQAWQALAPDAVEQARRIDARADRPLLRGLPVGIKDLIDTAHLPTTYGSSIYEGHQPKADAACVRALRAAGAVILGKTVTTEFAAYVGGKTRNPHDPSRTPGGSSSGSAAAVGDRMLPAALGSQTAGSVIRPASFCGAVGYKPTFGAFDLQGVHPLAPSLDTLGFFVRQVADVPWIAAALSGGARPAAIVELARPPRLGLCRTDQWARAERTTQRLVEDAAVRLGSAGAEVRDIEAFAGLAAAQAIVMAVEAAQVFREERQRNDARLSPTFRALLEEGERCAPERLREARGRGARPPRARRRVRQRRRSVDARRSGRGADRAAKHWRSRVLPRLDAPRMSLHLASGAEGPRGFAHRAADRRDA